MKFITFTDLHEDTKLISQLVARAKENDIEFMLCCGDISNFGRGLKEFFEAFEKVGKPMYVIPGNHEEMGTMFEDTVKKFDYVTSLHGKAQKIGRYTFLGYGGGGFALEDVQFRRKSREWYGEHKGKPIILVTHGPPYGTKLDFLENHGHVGNKDYSKFIKRISPKLVICGHLHENNGKIETIDGIKMVNPGWEGVTIELP